jgi:two-component system response regulator NreC
MQNDKKVISVIIADDHELVRSGIRSLIEKRSDMKVVAEAENGLTTLKLVQKLSPNVVIMDVKMSNLNGIEATRQVLDNSPGVKILALSMHSDKEFIREMLKAGASGYMLKDSAFSELVNAIHVVVSNKVYLDPNIVKIVTEDYVCSLPNNDSSIRSVLTSGELEAIQLLAEGKSMKQIARILNVSIKTIEARRRKTMDKLGIDNIADLVKYAIREGLTSF